MTVSLGAVPSAWGDARPATERAAGGALPVLIADEGGSEPQWDTHRTEHFTVHYRGAPIPAIRHATLLEQAHERFQEAFGRDPFRLSPLREPLVALVFEDKADYLRYARQTDHVDMSWTLAYYSARTNRTAFFRYGRHHTDTTVAGQSDATSALHEPATANDHATPYRPLDPHLALASATHEAAHQLAFNTGLQQRGVIYPLWASEGLATNFELAEVDGRFGPAFENVSRARRLAEAHRSGAILPLDEFICLTRVPADARATDEAYAQAWGLFHYLYLHRTDALAEYLAAMREVPHGHRSATELHDDFVAAFGPVHELEQRWLAWVRDRAASRDR